MKNPISLHAFRRSQAAEPSELLLISDVDLQFFRPVLPTVRKAMAGKEMCLQREFVGLGVNIGFMALRRCEAVRAFWHKVYKAGALL